MEYHDIIITGGAGFVGSSLALRLKQTYPFARVRSVDNLSRKGSELNLSRLEREGVEFVHGDVRYAPTFEALGTADLVLDCAAEPSVMAGTGGSPLYAIETNLWGTVNALEFVRTRKARLVFLSSSRMYPIEELNAIETRESDTRFVIAPQQSIVGVSERGISEQFPLGDQRTLYGATKLASEMLIREYALLYGTQAIINRCGVVAGPWQFGKVDQGVAVLWMARHIFKQPLSYVGFGGEGKQVRDFLHIEDLWDALAREITDFGAFVGKTFNIGGGIESSTSLLELTELCRQISGNTIPIASVPETRWGDVKLYISDCTRFTEASGWRPRRNVGDIMRDIHEWIIGHEDQLKLFLGQM